jgi:hypothetical protein
VSHCFQLLHIDIIRFRTAGQLIQMLYQAIICKRRIGNVRVLMKCHFFDRVFSYSHFCCIYTVITIICLHSIERRDTTVIIVIEMRCFIQCVYLGWIMLEDVTQRKQRKMGNNLTLNKAKK